MIDRDRILEFVETWRVQLVAACAGVLLVLLIVVVIIGFTGNGRSVSAKDTAAMKARAIDANELWIPSEPLGVPGVQLFSEPGVKWSVDEAKKWYTVPDDEMFGKLRSVSRKQIDELLESVP